MKNQILFYLLFGSLLFVQFSCKKSDANCGSTDFTAIDFTKYPSLMVENDIWEDKFLIINSTDEFNKWIKFKDLAPVIGQLSEIDYNKYILLIGKKKTSYLYGQLKSQSITCVSGKKTYNLVVVDGGYTALGRYIFGVLIPKADKKILFLT